MKAFQSLIFLLVASSMIYLVGCAKPNYEETPRNPAVDEAGACDAYLSRTNACVRLIWEKKPTNEEKGTFVVEFYNPEDRSQFMDLPGALEVVLWMPSMGHGSTPVTVEQLATGQYRVSNVFFVMPGDWEIQFKLKIGNAILDQAALPYHY